MKAWTGPDFYYFYYSILTSYLRNTVVKWDNIIHLLH